MVERNWCQRAKVDNSYAMTKNAKVLRENVFTATNQQAHVISVRITVNQIAVA